jgi:hypothetical protein
VLLLETGLPAETLRGAVQRHQEYLMFLDRARQGLPDVYDEAGPG